MCVGVLAGKNGVQTVFNDKSLHQNKFTELIKTKELFKKDRVRHLRKLRQTKL